MNILVVGSGGREHAICLALAKSPRKPKLFCAPGNAGIEGIAELVPIGAEDVPKLFAWVRDHQPDLVVVGPEVPLALGLTDEMEALGVLVFGPSKAAAQVESSKDFTKQLLFDNHIPTARSKTFTDESKALEYLKTHGAPVVVKADGLAAGKGVTVCLKLEEALQAVREAMTGKVFGEAGNRVVIEDFLEGEEASLLAFVDGRTLVPMVSAQDHKRALEGDLGPNTGGMGAYSPAPVVTPAMEQVILDKILKPTLEGLRKKGIPYKGVLYAGLMITKDGPQVIEYNCRFGDPETQVILPRLKTDLVEVFLACAKGKLADLKIEWDPRPSATVVMASQGYPGSYVKGKVLSGLEAASRLDDTYVYHSGTVRKDGQTVTSGGRVLSVTGVGKDIRQALERAYAGVSLISFEGSHHRRDIGWRALARG